MLHSGHNEIDGVPVEVVRKRIRRINIRVAADGTVCLSVPKWWATLRQGEDFLREKWRWVQKTRAEVLAEDRLLNLMVYPQKKPSNNPFQMLLAPQNQQNTISDEEKQRLSSRRDEVREQLRRGELEDTEIEIEVAEKTPELEVGGNSINLGDMMGGLMPPKTKQRRVKVKEARRILIAEEAEKLRADIHTHQCDERRALRHRRCFRL